MDILATLNGTENDDNISGFGLRSSDTLFSSTYGGDDAVLLSLAKYDVHLGDGNDVLQGGTGGVGYGEAGSDRMDAFIREGTHAHYGGDGDDRLNVWYGGTGSTYTGSGGAGTDQFTDYTSAPALVSFDGGDGFDVVTHSGTTAISLTLGATGNQGGALKSYSGIEGVVGGFGHDTMTGTHAGNLMVGGNGGDLIRGDAGNDFLIGEGRNVSFIRAYLGLNSNFSVADAFDPLNAAVSGTYAEDDGLSDSLYGGSGNDVLSGGDGADLLDGGTGNDWVSYMSSAEHLSLALNLTTGGISGQAAGDQFVSIENVLGSNGNDTITGNSGANELRGMGNRDLLSGLDGRDTLNGGTYSDTLAGGRYSDVLTGGSDAEAAFVFAGPGTLASFDTITDFQVNFDEIWLSAATFRKLGAPGALAAERFALGTATEADDRIIYDAATGALFYDADGKRVGLAVQFAQLATGLALTELDFVLIA